MWNLIAASGAFIVVAGLSGALVFASLWVSHHAYAWYRGSNARPVAPEDAWAETAMEPQMSEEEWAAMLATDLPPEPLVRYEGEVKDVDE